MRLLSVKDLRLQEFSEFDKVPPYAILSHTWEKDEVSLDDIMTDKSKRKVAYAKIKNSCRLAANGGLEFVWVDTCCIDQSYLRRSIPCSSGMKIPECQYQLHHSCIVGKMLMIFHYQMPCLS